MEVIADLHLHSKYSRAVSQQMVISEIAYWAIKKGIDLVGTADWTHPLWLRELKEDLKEVEEGIYKLKDELLKLKNQEKEVYFILATEIASIYTQNGKPHRIHNLVLAPSFAVVEKINEKLRAVGVNLFADGRPTTGLSCPQLCELIWGVEENCLIIPAHVWTPWYSLYGSRSGFNSLRECFGKYADKIHAIETGLSSDPAMNWRIKELDQRSIVSFSDAHSPAKLGREATVFALGENKVPNSKSQILKFSFTDIVEAIKNQDIAYTIEFYPEEGKYHWTGHRSCGVRHSSEETRKKGSICPVCGKPLTVGVMYRVDQLANRESKTQIIKFKTGVRLIFNEDKTRPPYVMLVPLLEILAEAMKGNISSHNVLNEYNKLTSYFGSEFKVLLEAPIEELAKISGEKVAKGIKRVREGEIVVEPGYDGVFGTVKIWPEGEDVEKEEEQGQMSLF
ncbi:MAG: endonuclease Q family protein [Microgenomates group bacterium]